MEKKLIRTFICIDFPKEIIGEIARVQELIGKNKFIGKFTEVENLHLTLKFLGEISEERLEKIRKLLKDIKFDEMSLKLGNIGTFTYKGNPRIIWIKILGQEIWSLQSKIDKKMNELGFKLEEDFMSHLTIARIKYVKNKKEFIESVKNVNVREVKFKKVKFKLKSSELKPIGPVYTTIQEYIGEKI